MERKKFIHHAIGLGLAFGPIVKSLNGGVKRSADLNGWKLSGPREPLFIYNNWSAYDELSDHVAQTEALCMKELGEIVRLKRLGVRMDHYVMDAFWFGKEGGYRSWSKEHWPQGPDRWLQACKENQIKPGMWFSTNLVTMGGKQVLDIIPAWQDSLGTDRNILCLFDGGYLAHLAETLQIWYDKGVRLFKFDFAYFEAVTPAMKNKYTTEEVKEKNKQAFMSMLQEFRKNNKDVLITGYNGFGGDMENTVTDFRKTIDHRWLDTFDTLYSGDPRFSDVPMMNIWRSQDNYSDHMNRQFEFNGLPFYRIDNCAFMIGTTGTCYYRGLQAWKGMAILEFARGGWVNVLHGNLESLSDEDGKWLAKVQSIYMPLQKQNQVSSFGEIPGKGQGYGFKAKDSKGEILTIVNASQQNSSIKLPSAYSSAQILYADGGFKPVVRTADGSLYIELGAEQMAVVGTGIYKNEAYDLGTDQTIQIPDSVVKIGAVFKEAGKNKIACELKVAGIKNLRVGFQQYDSYGKPYRSWGGAPPDGKKMNELLTITVMQNGKEIPTKIHYDKMIWSGLSWAMAEADAKQFDPALPLSIQCASLEKTTVTLKGWVSEVIY